MDHDYSYHLYMYMHNNVQTIPFLHLPNQQRRLDMTQIYVVTLVCNYAATRSKECHLRV